VRKKRERDREGKKEWEVNYVAKRSLEAMDIYKIKCEDFLLKECDTMYSNRSMLTFLRILISFHQDKLI
jgi:hypothetical protein